MSDAEALMWNAEKDPALRSSFLNVTFLAHPPRGPDALKWIEHATQALHDLGAPPAPPASGGIAARAPEERTGSH